MNPDVSLVLNVSGGEALYLPRTLRSLEAAVARANAFGLTSELIVVLDRADGPTTALVESWPYAGFASVRRISVSNGSLALSRNSGVEVARGRYVSVCDADDLVSSDFIKSSYETARDLGPMACVFPEWLFVFGVNDPYVHRFYSSAHVGDAVFSDDHPFNSRIFAPRDILQRVPYRHPDVAQGYAYEDWLLNCDLLSLGCQFEIAGGAILFYRRKSAGLLSVSNAVSLGVIPESSFFDPESYVVRVEQFVASGQKKELPEAGLNPLTAFKSNSSLMEMVREANCLDPGISALDLCGGVTNLGLGSPIGDAYYRVCRQLLERRFTDVVLLPSFGDVSGEAGFLDVLEALQAIDPATTPLFLVGERGPPPRGLDLLPPGAEIIDLPRVSRGNDERVLQVLTLRILSAFAPSARLHFTHSTYGCGFVRRYGRMLGRHRVAYYRSADRRCATASGRWVDGAASNFLTEALGWIDKVITDHEAIARADRERYGVSGEKWRRLHFPASAAAVVASEPARRLLWASRLTSQNRPELLVDICRELDRHGLAVRIDAFALEGDLTPDVLSGAPNLNYCGVFEQIEDIEPQAYDGFLHTALFDGLPHIVLEAMGRGLPVFAVDVGGLGEVVIEGDTGRLIPDEEDDEGLVGRYVAAIRQFYEPDFSRATMREAARALVVRRHGWSAFVQQVRGAFVDESSPVGGE